MTRHAPRSPSRALLASESCTDSLVGKPKKQGPPKPLWPDGSPYREPVQLRFDFHDSDTTSQIGNIEQTYEKSAKEDLNQTIGFTLHPNFDENHSRRPPTPQHSIECQDDEWKADQIQDNASREDYVRYYDQYARSKETMANVIFAYEAKLRDANNIINRTAQESLIH
jgi:hypothetical protein